MTTPYIIILSDSEEESENIPVLTPISDSHNESSESEPMEEEEILASENVNIENAEPSEEEEDPSEADPSETSPGVATSETPISPSSTFVPNNFSGAHTIYTARKQVVIPRRQRTLSPETSTPSIDPYIAPNSNTHRRTDARRWTWLPETLQSWREDEGFPIITEEGESSTSRRDFPFTREPPHHTVPLVVVRMATHELRMDHLEDAVDEMPGTEAYENLEGEVQALEHRVENMHDREGSLEDQLVELGEATLELASREVDYINRIQNLESRMAQKDQDMIKMQGDIDRLTAMATASMERDAMIFRGDHHR